MWHRKLRLTRDGLVVLFGSAVAVALACIDAADRNGPGRVTGPRLPAAATGSVALTEAQRERAEAALEKMKFAGEIHNEAMRDLTTNLKLWVGDSRVDLPRFDGHRV